MTGSPGGNGPLLLTTLRSLSENTWLCVSQRAGTERWGNRRGGQGFTVVIRLFYKQKDSKLLTKNQNTGSHLPSTATVGQSSFAVAVNGSNIQGVTVWRVSLGCRATSSFTPCGCEYHRPRSSDLGYTGNRVEPQGRCF